MNVQGVAAAIEEMAATGAEISRQVSRAATISARRRRKAGAPMTRSPVLLPRRKRLAMWSS